MRISLIIVTSLTIFQVHAQDVVHYSKVKNGILPYIENEEQLNDEIEKSKTLKEVSFNTLKEGFKFNPDKLKSLSYKDKKYLMNGLLPIFCLGNNKRISGEFLGQSYTPCPSNTKYNCNFSKPATCPRLPQDKAAMDALEKLGIAPHFKNFDINKDEDTYLKSLGKFQALERYLQADQHNRDVNAQLKSVKDKKAKEIAAEKERIMQQKEKERLASKAKKDDIVDLINQCSLDNSNFSENKFIQETICNDKFTTGFTNADVENMSKAMNKNTRDNLINTINAKVFEDSLNAIYTTLPIEEQKKFNELGDKEFCKLLRTHAYNTRYKITSPPKNFMDARNHPVYKQAQYNTYEDKMGACEDGSLPPDLKQSLTKVQTSFKVKPPLKSIFNEPVSETKKKFDTKLNKLKSQCSNINNILQDCIGEGVNLGNGDIGNQNGIKALYNYTSHDIRMYCIEQNANLFNNLQNSMEKWTKDQSFMLLLDDNLRDKVFNDYGSKDGIDLNSLTENCIDNKDTFLPPSTSDLLEARKTLQQSMTDRLVHENNTRSPDYDQGLVFFGDDICKISEDDKRQLNVLYNYLKSHPQTIANVANKNGNQSTYLNAICEASKCIKEVKKAEDKAIDYAKQGTSAILMASAIIPGAQVLTTPFTYLSASLNVLDKARKYNQSNNYKDLVMQGLSTNGFGPIEKQYLENFDKIEKEAKEDLKGLYKEIIKSAMKVKGNKELAEKLTTMFRNQGLVKQIYETRKKLYPDAPKLNAEDYKKLINHFVTSTIKESTSVAMSDEIDKTSVGLYAADILLLVSGSKLPLKDFEKSNKENLHLVLTKGKSKILELKNDMINHFKEIETH